MKNGLSATIFKHDFTTHILIIAVFILFESFYNSAFDAYRYGGVDLRVKITGAKKITRGDNPYHNEVRDLKRNDLVDSLGLYPGPSRTTYTPALLMFPYSPAMEMPYYRQRILWWMLEWLCIAALLGIGYFCIRDKKIERLGIILLLLMVSAYFVRLHIERGQYYVFLSLSILIEYRLFKTKSKFAGILTGICSSWRFPMLIFLPLGWLMGRKRFACNLLASFAAMVFLSTALYGFKPWKDYVSHVEVWGNIIYDKKYFSGYVASATPPAKVDGYFFPDTLDARSSNNSLVEFLSSLHEKTSDYKGMLDEYGNIKKLMASLAIILFAGFCYLIVKLRVEDRIKFSLVFTSILLIDFLLPIRWSYADVLLFPSVIFFLDTYDLNERSGYTFILLASVFVFSLGYFETPAMSLARPLIVIACVLDHCLSCGSASASGLALRGHDSQHHLVDPGHARFGEQG